MNPLLCQLSYAAMFEERFYGECGAGSTCENRPVGPAAYWARTLLMVKIGNSNARATPPMIRPMTTIIRGSM
jgi:hypothetical protein